MGDITSVRLLNTCKWLLAYFLCLSILFYRCNGSCRVAHQADSLHTSLEISGSQVAGRIELKEDCSLLIQGLRYNHAHSSRWWGLDNNSDTFLVSTLALDSSLDGTQEVSAEVSSTVPWEALVALELRSVEGEVVLARVDLVKRTPTSGSSSRKLLQQDCNSSCTFSFKGSTETYCYCTTFDDKYKLKVFWDKAVQGSDGTTMEMAFQSGLSTSPGYVAIAFPSTPRIMEGASAVVAKSSSSGNVEAEQYSLAGYQASLVQPANNLQLGSSLQSEYSNDQVAVKFTVQSNTAVSLKAGTQNMLYAFGGLTSSGSLKEHTFKNDKDITIVVGTAESAPPPAPATGAAAPAPAPASGGQGGSCDSSCTITFGGSSTSFCQCATYPDSSGSFKLFWDEATSSNGDNSVNMAFQGATTDGWVGLGFPKTAGVMVGSSAVVAQVDSSASSGASVQQYFLGAYSTSGVVPANNLTLNDLQAEASNSLVKARFTLQQNKVVTLSASGSGSDVDIIYAIGPLNNGKLAAHPEDNSGAEMFTLRSAGSTSAVPMQDTKAPATAPAQEPAEEPTEEAQAPAPSATSTLASCSVSVADQQLQYDRCSMVSGTPLTIYWLKTDSSTPTKFQGALSYSGQGWGAVAFPSTPGQMVGANAIIVKEDSTTNTGASVDGYFLASESSAGVNPPAKFNLLSKNASKIGSTLVGTFEVDLAGVVNSLDGVTAMIWGWGPVAGNALVQHTERGSFTLDFATGGDVAATGGSKDQTLGTVHGVLMAVSYGIMFPLGIGIARCMKWLDPAWFYVHMICMSLGYLLGLAGWITGWVLAGTSSKFGLHKGLGIAVFTLFTVQLLTVTVRPKPHEKLRRTWNLVHWWVGRIGLGLAVWNIYEGLITVYPGIFPGSSMSGYVIAYSVVLGIVVGMFFAWEAVAYARLAPPSTYAHPPGTRLPDDAAGRFTGTQPEEIVQKLGMTPSYSEQQLVGNGMSTSASQQQFVSNDGGVV